MTSVKNLLKTKQSMIPKSGYNLVEMDGMAELGEELTLIAHYEDKAEALEAQKTYAKANPAVKVYLYDKSTQ